MGGFGSGRPSGSGRDRDAQMPLTVRWDRWLHFQVSFAGRKHGFESRRERQLNQRLVSLYPHQNLLVREIYGKVAPERC
jgi:hypothetical protein